MPPDTAPNGDQDRITDSAAPDVVTAYLGWGNAERDKAGMRLYATDRDDSPRWADDPGGRVAEYAAIERGATEGDRFLIVRLGNRFVKREDAEAVAQRIQEVLDGT